MQPPSAPLAEGRRGGRSAVGGAGKPPGQGGAGLCRSSPAGPGGDRHGNLGPAPAPPGAAGSAAGAAGFFLPGRRQVECGAGAARAGREEPRGAAGGAQAGLVPLPRRSPARIPPGAAAPGHPLSDPGSAPRERSGAGLSSARQGGACSSSPIVAERPLRVAMAEGAAAAPACFSEDDFYCPVCQEVFKTPVRTANCQHVWVSRPPPLPKPFPRLLRLSALCSSVPPRSRRTDPRPGDAGGEDTSPVRLQPPLASFFCSRRGPVI